MAAALTAALLALPLLGSLLSAAISWYGSRVLGHRVALAAVGSTALCALALLSQTGSASALALQWLPGTGSMTLAVGFTGLCGLLVTVWCLFPALLGGTSVEAQCPPLSPTVTLLALSGASVGFLTDHFLARYVALEVVTLCIATALVVGEVRERTGVRLAWRSYVLLRLGDVALLGAILMLKETSGTLAIGAALESGLTSMSGVGRAPAAGRLAWVVAGFVLAAWVKLGGWPFHLWLMSGRQLGTTSRAWLYATVMPNLGMYLLYRVTPLLAVAGPLQAVALWLGSAGVALASLTILTRVDAHSALVHVGAAQGGLALLMAASGLQAAVWLTLLALTPVRLLLYLAADAARGSRGSPQRRIAVGAFALGGLVLTLLSMLATWWARDSGAPPGPLLLAQTGVVLTGVWAARATWRLLRPPGDRGQLTVTSPPRRAQQVVACVLGCGVLVGALGFRLLASRLVAIAGLASLEIPALPALLRYSVTVPAVLTAAVWALAAWFLWPRLGAGSRLSALPTEEWYDLEEQLSRTARTLRSTVEVGILERLLVLVVRVVVEGAAATYRVVEQGGLEGLLRRSVAAILLASRWLQSQHTGRLRNNLLWAAGSLVLAVVALLVCGA